MSVAHNTHASIQYSVVSADDCCEITCLRSSPITTCFKASRHAQCISQPPRLTYHSLASMSHSWFPNMAHIPQRLTNVSHTPWRHHASCIHTPTIATLASHTDAPLVPRIGTTARPPARLPACLCACPDVTSNNLHCTMIDYDSTSITAGITNNGLLRELNPGPLAP